MVPTGEERRDRYAVRVIVSLVCVASLAAGGCSSMGSFSMKKSHRRYEKGLAELKGQELLRNIVQLRYRDLVAFLDVSSITANFSLGANVGGNAPLGNPKSYEGNLVPFSAGIQALENPTITFAPLFGREFVRRMCTPLNIDTIFLLTLSGWSVERTVLMTVSSANGLLNSSQVFDQPVDETGAGYKDFLRLADLLNSLSKSRKLSWEFQEDPVREKAPPKEFIIIFRDPSDPQTVEVKKLLRLQSDRNRFYVYYDNICEAVSEQDTSKKGDVLLITRSMNQVLFDLSNAVEVPEKHIQKGLALPLKQPEEGNSAGAEVNRHLFRVCSSKLPPSDAYLSIEHRGYHFYIQESDMESKVTLLLLQMLIDLQAGSASSQTPILTLPVAK